MNLSLGSNCDLLFFSYKELLVIFIEAPFYDLLNDRLLLDLDPLRREEVLRSCRIGC